MKTMNTKLSLTDDLIRGMFDGDGCIFTNFQQKLVPIFNNVRMPHYKQQQWDRLLQAIDLMQQKKHSNPQEWCKLINLTYDLTANSKRKHPKNYYYNPDFRPRA